MILERNDGLHDWNKLNLVTEKDGRGMHDRLQCVKCGLKGKARNLTQIEVSSKSNKKALRCDGSKTESVSKVRVTRCTAFGPQFENLIPNSEHETMPTPKQYINEYYPGVWVMGVGEPVKLLSNEYIVIT